MKLCLILTCIVAVALDGFASQPINSSFSHVVVKEEKDGYLSSNIGEREDGDDLEVILTTTTILDSGSPIIRTVSPFVGHKITKLSVIYPKGDAEVTISPPATNPVNELTISLARGKNNPESLKYSILVYGKAI
ncbi:hypothetical protein QAD02_005233 [Eretmocerus hayati]|uniref:Uncharacterized protein n=1 Tax=Eretmocerus hayati TaxID=131215 RepID=A0ACC2NS48_9HYME|nr:hypothetical protein QAD02_005233 [Eretmocerus hayati]